MGVSLRLQEEDAQGRIRNIFWLLNEFPSSDDYFIASSFDLGYPEATVSSYGRTEGNGTIDISRFHGSSTVTVDGILPVGPDTVMRHDQLRSMCMANRRCYLYINRPEWGGERRMKLRANSYSFVSDSTAAAFWKITLSFTNPSGEMESADLQSQVFSTSLGGGDVITPPTDSSALGHGYGSLFYGAGLYGSRPAPLMMMRLFGDPAPTTVETTDDVVSFGYGRGGFGTRLYGSDGSEGAADTAVLNRGTIAVEPQIIVQGSFSNLQLTFNSIGTSMYFPNLDVTDADKLVIDIPSKSVLLNGDFAASKYSALSLSKGDGWNGWPTLEPGVNDVDIFTSARGGNFSVTFIYRDGWV